MSKNAFNLVLLVVVAFVFWKTFGTKGDSILPSTPAAPSPPTDESTVANSTGDVTATNVTP